jgi:hypothetical protein
MATQTKTPLHNKKRHAQHNKETTRVDEIDGIDGHAQKQWE